MVLFVTKFNKVHYTTSEMEHLPSPASFEAGLYDGGPRRRCRYAVVVARVRLKRGCKKRACAVRRSRIALVVFLFYSRKLRFKNQTASQ